LSDNFDWDAVAEQAGAGRLEPVKGTELRGEDAARSGRDALLIATGTEYARTHQDV
jgi:hypothetical protein